MPKHLFAVMMILCTVGIATHALAHDGPTDSRIEFDGGGAASEVVSAEVLPPYLATLLQAGSVDDAAIGFAAVKSVTYQAFEEAIAQGSQIRPEIEYVLQAGTPAGRVYAAVLLRRLDEQAGEAAITQLRTEEVMVMRFSGCDRSPVSMAEAIDDMLRYALRKS
jgi:hypothetical protein